MARKSGPDRYVGGRATALAKWISRLTPALDCRAHIRLAWSQPTVEQGLRTATSHKRNIRVHRDVAAHGPPVSAATNPPPRLAYAPTFQKASNQRTTYDFPMYVMNVLLIAANEHTVEDPFPYQKPPARP